jgi:ABC-type antimicrobial peptide transport system permease subunit
LATAISALGCLAIAAFLDASERRLELASLLALGATRSDILVTSAARSAAIAVLAAGRRHARRGSRRRSDG